MLTKFPGSSCNDVVCTDENNIVSGHFVSILIEIIYRVGGTYLSYLDFAGPSPLFPIYLAGPDKILSFLKMYKTNFFFQDKRIRFWDIRSGTEPIKDLEFGGKVTSVVCIFKYFDW